jgi:hypothetical protein
VVIHVAPFLLALANEEARAASTSSYAQKRIVEKWFRLRCESFSNEGSNSQLVRIERFLFFLIATGYVYKFSKN